MEGVSFRLLGRASWGQGLPDTGTRVSLIKSSGRRVCKGGDV
jgi:hypothetical protein